MTLLYIQKLKIKKLKMMFKLLEMLKNVSSALTDKLYALKNRWWQLNIIIIILIVVLGLIILKEYGSITIWQSYLEEQVITNKVIIEDAKGYIDIYYKDENKKIKKLKSYPIELVLIYDFDSYNSKLRLLKEILKDQFLNCKIEAKPVACKMVSFVDSKKDNDKGFDVLNGETFGGLYKNNKNNKNIHFKFIYFIQDADGYNLNHMDKLWPLLHRIIENTHSKNNFYSNLHNNLDAKLRIDMTTLKIRKGIITSSSYDFDILVHYYKETYKWKPTILLTQGDKKCYLIVVDVPMNNYYVNIFKNKSNNLRYLKKIYDIDIVNNRLRFVIHWFRKYDRYT